MDLRKPIGFILVLIFFLLPLSRNLFGNCVPATAADQESGIDALNYIVPITKFDGIRAAFDSFNSDVLNEKGQVGGFVFIPIRITSQADLNDGPLNYQIKGLRVHVAYFTINGNGQRDIEIFGLLDDPQYICNAFPAADPRYIILPNDVTAGQPSDPSGGGNQFPGDDVAAIASVKEMDLSYLPIEDYEYLRNIAFVNSNNQAASTGTPVRSIQIQRSVVGQGFDIAAPNSTDLVEYRTLSFRVHPYPNYTDDAEAVMAFKYGYYCPPYWGTSSGGSQQDNTEFTNNDEPPTSDSLSGKERFERVLSVFMRDQLEERRILVEEFSPPRPTTTSSDAFILKYKYWLAFLLLVIGFILGRIRSGN